MIKIISRRNVPSFDFSLRFLSDVIYIYNIAAGLAWREKMLYSRERERAISTAAVSILALAVLKGRGVVSPLWAGQQTLRCVHLRFSDRPSRTAI